MVQQRRAAARLLCNSQDTSILTPQWPPCLCDLQSTTIACVSVFFCVRHSTRTQFFTRMSDHGPPNPQFLSTSITKINGSCSSSSDWRCAVAGRAFVTSVDTHPRGLPLRGFLSHHGTKTTWAMAFPRINCRTTTATVLTATATVTLSLRACLFLCYTPITSPSAADSFYFLELLGMG